MLGNYNINVNLRVLTTLVDIIAASTIAMVRFLFYNTAPPMFTLNCY